MNGEARGCVSATACDLTGAHKWGHCLFRRQSRSPDRRQQRQRSRCASAGVVHSVEVAVTQLYLRAAVQS